MQKQQSPGENYLLGQTPEAHQRLLITGQLFNPFTRRVLTEAGITTGMHVLDVGAVLALSVCLPQNWWARQVVCLASMPTRRYYSSPRRAPGPLA